MSSQDEMDGSFSSVTDNAVTQLAPVSNLLGLSVSGASPSAMQVCYCARLM